MDSESLRYDQDFAPREKTMSKAAPMGLSFASEAAMESRRLHCRRWLLRVPVAKSTLRIRKIPRVHRCTNCHCRRVPTPDGAFNLTASGLIDCRRCNGMLYQVPATVVTNLVAALTLRTRCVISSENRCRHCEPCQTTNHAKICL